MKTKGMTVLALAGSILVAPAFAGQEAKKCSADAEVCVREMATKLENKGWIGIEMHERDEKGRPVVTRVVPGSPAVEAGFRQGDVLVAINGVSDADGEEAAYAEWKKSMIPGNQITITVEREDKAVDLDVNLGNIPDALVAQWVGEHVLRNHAAPPENNTPRP